MEAGNRCYDENVPEEANRKVVDSLSSYLLPYTQRSREQLLTEGYHPSKIIVTGNPITEVLEKHMKKAIEPTIKDYILVTLHRDENVTNKETLSEIIEALNEIGKTTKVILSAHPKMEEMVMKFGLTFGQNIEVSKPFGFHVFLGLEKFAKCVLTDSGTVPEECAIIKTPCILIRTSTERPELLETNTMILSGVSKDEILSNYDVACKL